MRLAPGTSLLIKYNGKRGKIDKLITRNGRFEVEVENWQTKLTLFRNQKAGGVWYIATNINDLNHNDAVDLYRKRFRIEKVFQDFKSSGFDMENIKIRKYTRFKNMLFLCCMTYSLMILLGDFIENKLPDIKKLTNIYKSFNSLFQLARKFLAKHTTTAKQYLRQLITLIALQKNRRCLL